MYGGIIFILLGLYGLITGDPLRLLAFSKWSSTGQVSSKYPGLTFLVLGCLALIAGLLSRPRAGKR